MQHTIKRFCLTLTILTGVIISGLIGVNLLFHHPVHAAVGDGSPTDPNIHYIGRWDTNSSTGAISYWGGAYLKTNFTGTTVQIKLASSANIYVSIDNSADVYYSGANGIVNLTPTPLAPGTHTLRIAARSEWDSIQFQGLILDPGATTLAPTISPWLIEFVGDSITSGLTDTKASLSDYAWLTGEQLGVEHTQIAFSGVCLLNNCQPTSTIGMSTQFFKEQTFQYPNSPDWDFSRYQASEVVINLGTNDSDHVSDAAFQAVYIQFLQNIRQKYPNATILVLRTFLGIKTAPTQAAVQARNAAGDTNVHYVDTTGWITPGTSDYNDGAHPSDSGHAKVAQRLAPILASYLPGTPTPTPTPTAAPTPSSTPIPTPTATPITGAVSIPNAGFETPNLGSGGWQYNPTGASWTFSSSSGISNNNSSFTSGAPDAPEGNQVAFLQKNGSISQKINFPAGTYTLSFEATQRVNSQSSSEDFQALIDGQSIGSFTPPSSSYSSYTTSSFVVTAGSHTLQFQGLDNKGGDNSAFIDAISINSNGSDSPPTPTPTSTPSPTPTPTATPTPTPLPTAQPTPTATPTSGGSVTLSNPGFETPNLGAGGWQYNPTGATWTFTASGPGSNGYPQGSGISNNGSSFTSGAPNAPEGSQVAFLQGTGSISQAVNFSAGGTYTLSFQASQRANSQSSSQDFQVLIDGQVVGTFRPSSGTYGSYTTNSFVVTAGQHTLQFQGLDSNGGDNTAFIDAVAINGPM